MPFNNMQVLGWAYGNNINEAFENFKNTQKYFGNYSIIALQEIIGELEYIYKE